MKNNIVNINTGDTKNNLGNLKSLNSEHIKTNIKPNVFDVAKYILEKLGEMTTIKLQKLVYYCQAWSLVWDEEELFPEKIEAWVNGPVVPKLFYQHKGMFKVNTDTFVLGNTKKLSENQKDTIDHVLDFYGNKTGHTLIEMSHNEKPWTNARKGYDQNAICSREITKEEIIEYYSSLSNG